MPIRTDDGQVQAILSDYNSTVDLSPFIEDASLMVDDNCLESDYTNAKLERIETWLAAHLYETAHGRVVTEQVSTSGGAGRRVTMESKIGLGLDLTRYGQMVKRLDNEGNLAAMDNAMNTVKKGLLAPSVIYLGRNGTT